MEVDVAYDPNIEYLPTEEKVEPYVPYEQAATTATSTPYATTATTSTIAISPSISTPQKWDVNKIIAIFGFGVGVVVCIGIIAAILKPRG